MKYLQTILFIACLSLVACTPKYIKQYKKKMIENPSGQAQIDQNLILEYLAENKLNFDSTSSGIYYSINPAGEGEHPKAESIVNVHYKGYHLDGKVFDSSYDRGEPIEFPLGNVIEGWQKAIPLLKSGGKGTFIIPSGLAYGERGAGADIPAHSVLIFDVELLDHYTEAEKAGRQQKKDQKKITDYLTENGLSAQKTESGIHYIITREGSGSSPSQKDNVKVHYKGSLLDGTTFDSSYERDEMITFPLSRVVAGWQESIPLLKEGGAGIFFIPSQLAYGERGAGGVIPANAVLKFEVELFEVIDEARLAEIQKEEAAKAAEAAKAQIGLDDQIIKDYITANKLDAKRTPEGIYYITEKEGSTPKPTVNSEVTVHYKGTLLDGSKFDSSYDRGQAATFSLQRVVKGWQIGIPLFGKGGKGTLLIPSHLAYGSRGAGASIPANAVLRFDIELIDIK